MRKEDLAQQLRQRQIEYGKIDASIISSISDDEIIDSYITCSCCHEKQVSPEQLKTIIGNVEDVDGFFEACDVAAKFKEQILGSAHNIVKAKGF